MEDSWPYMKEEDAKSLIKYILHCEKMFSENGDTSAKMQFEADNIYSQCLENNPEIIEYGLTQFKDILHLFGFEIDFYVTCEDGEILFGISHKGFSKSKVSIYTNTERAILTVAKI